MSTRRRKLDRFLIWASGPVAVTWANYPFLSLPFTHTQRKRNGIRPYPFYPGKSRDSQWGREKVRAAGKNSILTQNMNPFPTNGAEKYKGASIRRAFFEVLCQLVWLLDFQTFLFRFFPASLVPLTATASPKMHHLSSVPKPKLHWF